MKKLVAIALGVLGIFSLLFYFKHPLQTTVTIRNATFVVHLAITPTEKEMGLGYRAPLPPDRGMLFVYDHKERYPFWMRNMRFPIDIIWIDDKIIADITKNVPLSDKPVEELPIYHPVVPVDKVLELPAGTADRFGMMVGDQLTIKS